MIFAVLALTLALAPATADPIPSQIEEGCAHVPGSREMTRIEVGIFYDSPTPSFVDSRFRAVRVGTGWQRSDRSPYSGAQTRAWFLDGSTISVGGRTYAKSSVPRILRYDALTFVGEHDGVAVVREARATATDVILVQTKGGQCEFQTYRAS